MCVYVYIHIYICNIANMFNMYLNKLSGSKSPTYT